MSQIAIQVENLSKVYKIGAPHERYDTLRDQIMSNVRSLFTRNASDQRLKDERFVALNDISFNVNKGEVVGLIGRNGAGKSTLLKVLSRITQPTTGRVKINGRVGSLLEVGTGFHPELTGRENIYLNGAILGMKQSEINRKFDEIVAFSEVEKFLDTPVKRYSSGMYVRLAFAVAAHLEPEVLIVDEVLSVGDAAFQKKCLGKIEGVAHSGRTVLFVSHNMAAVENLCQKVFLLQQGRLVFGGSAKQAIDYYLGDASDGKLASSSHTVDLTVATGRSPKYRVQLKRLDLFTDKEKPLNGSLRIGASLQARIHFHLDEPTARFDVVLGFDNYLGQRVFTASTAFQPDRPEDERVGDQTLVCQIPSLTLVPGEYKIKVLLSHSNTTTDSVEDAARITIIESDYYGTGNVPWNGFFVLKHSWDFQ